MYHLILAQFRHETNTFSPVPADFANFCHREYHEGADILRVYRGTHTETGGFLKVLDAQPDITVHPVVSAGCMPCGPVTDDMWNRVHDMLVSAIRSQPQVDGLLLAMHGAMATESLGDGEGEMLQSLRELVGPDCPIIVTLDLHANVSEKMVANADALCIYRGYPHSDMYERGIEAAEMMVKTLHGQIRPTVAFSPRPLLLTALPTAEPAMKKHVERAAAFEKEPGVLSVSIAHGFYCTDVPDDRLSTVAVTDNDPARAQAIADELADGLWADRALLQRKFYKPEDAIREAEASELAPVIFADVADNPGGGSTGDGTHLLRAMLQAGVRSAVVGLIYDPESAAAAAKAGPGSTVHLRLGGKISPQIMGEPIECDAQVLTISDGNYINDGPMNGGVPVKLGTTAVIRVDGVRIIVCSNVTQPYDPRLFRRHGIEPTEEKIIVLKSSVHYRAAFEPLAKKIYDIDCPGLMPVDVYSLDYRRLTRPIYPLDSI